MATTTVSADFLRQLEGYGLTTAEILYRLPDHRNFFQSYIWQEYDLAPNFPILTKFLKFWKTSIEGPLVSVRVGHEKLITPREIRLVGAEFSIN
jgi:uncharacterized protein Usg